MGLLGLGASLLGTAYVFRVPLLGGWVRTQAERKLGALGVGTWKVGRPSGTFFSWVSFDSLTLAPQAGGPVPEARTGKVTVRYPWLGLGGLEIEVQDAQISLSAGTAHGSSAPRPAPVPGPLETRFREGLRALETTKLPARFRVRNLELRIPGGPDLRIPEARIDRDRAIGSLVSEATGTVRWEISRGASHQLALDASVERGPLSRILIRLGPEEPAHPLRVECRVLGHEILVIGNATFGPGGQIGGLAAHLELPQGKAELEVDFESGQTRVLSEATFELEREIAGRGSLRGRLDGKLSEGLDQWKVSALEIHGSGTWKSLPIQLEVDSTGGTLAALGWRGMLRSGEDRIEAAGDLGWTSGFGLVSAVSLHARDLALYQSLMPGHEAASKALSYQGHVRYSQKGPEIDGILEIGAGHWDKISWEHLSLAASVNASQVDICQLVAEGLPGLRSGRLSGQIILDEKSRATGWSALVNTASPGGASFTVAASRLELDLPAGRLSEVLCQGHVGEQGLEISSLAGQVDEGRFQAAGRWNYRTSPPDLAAHLMGNDLLALSQAVARVRVSPDLWIEKTPRGWKLSGSVEIPSLLYYDDIQEGPSPKKSRVQAAAAPKLRLPPAAEGGVLLPLGWPGGRDVELDVGIRTRRPARIETSLVAALAGASLHVGGTLAQPSLSGTVQATRGEVKLTTGVVLRIDDFRLDLPAVSGAAPKVYFRGHSGKGQGAITAILSGPLENPSLALSSNPPRKQEELIAYLAFGHLPGDVGSHGALGVVATQVVAQASDERPRAQPKDGFWQKLDLTVASEDTPDANKRLPWDLPPTASARGTIVRTEYILDRLFSVVVESDRAANVSGDLKIRLHFR